MIKQSKLPLLIGRCALLAWIAAAGCKSHSQQNQSAAQGTIAPQQVQSQLMSFTNRYLISMQTVLNQVERNVKSPEVQLMIVRAKLVSGTTAIGHAVELNPFVGLMDMAVMVRINREIALQPWVSETFGPENAKMILAAIKLQEDDIWAIA